MWANQKYISIVLRDRMDIEDKVILSFQDWITMDYA